MYAAHNARRADALWPPGQGTADADRDDHDRGGGMEGSFPQTSLRPRAAGGAGRDVDRATALAHRTVVSRSTRMWPCGGMIVTRPWIFALSSSFSSWTLACSSDTAPRCRNPPEPSRPPGLCCPQDPRRDPRQDHRCHQGPRQGPRCPPEPAAGLRKTLWPVCSKCSASSGFRARWSTARRPQYMTELYDMVADTSGLTKASGPYNANTVRSFPDRGQCW